MPITDILYNCLKECLVFFDLSSVFLALAPIFNHFFFVVKRCKSLQRVVGIGFEINESLVTKDVCKISL